jgi:hypothetical protein
VAPGGGTTESAHEPTGAHIAPAEPGGAHLTGSVNPEDMADTEQSGRDSPDDTGARE